MGLTREMYGVGMSWESQVWQLYVDQWVATTIPLVAVKYVVIDWLDPEFTWLQLVGNRMRLG